MSVEMEVLFGSHFCLGNSSLCSEFPFLPQTSARAGTNLIYLHSKFPELGLHPGGSQEVKSLDG